MKIYKNITFFLNLLYLFIIFAILTYMKQFYIIFILIMALFITCGPILDPIRLSGTWKLDDVEFYVKNELLDSYKKYTGINDDYPDESHPLNSEFFDTTNDAFYIKFFTNETNVNKQQIEVYKGSVQDSDKYVAKERTNWYIDSFDNTLRIKIKSNSTANGFWADGFTIENPWPMISYDTMEITISASDISGISTFSVDLTNDILKVHSMRGIFRKQ